MPTMQKIQVKKLQEMLRTQKQNFMKASMNYSDLKYKLNEYQLEVFYTEIYADTDSLL